jgi:hypothetical protein
VKAPRFRITWVMVAVAIAALDLTAIRAMHDSETLVGEFLVVGALPMANILAVGILIARRRRGSRPFFLGFEEFGVIALALYVVSTISFRDRVVEPYLNLFQFLDPILEGIGGTPVVSVPIRIFIFSVILVLPQLAFALIGGFLSRRYRITITRRHSDKKCRQAC